MIGQKEYFLIDIRILIITFFCLMTIQTKAAEKLNGEKRNNTKSNQANIKILNDRDIQLRTQQDIRCRTQRDMRVFTHNEMLYHDLRELALHQAKNENLDRKKS